MARQPVLPLSDTSVRYILAHIDELQMMFPPTRGYRPFIAAFVRLVYQATGEVFGAGNVRKLLQTYAPEYTPSTTTIHKELQEFRAQLERYPESIKQEAFEGAPNPLIEQPRFSTEPPTATTSKRQRTPASPELGNLTAMLAGLQHSLANISTTPKVESSQHNDALSMALEAENQRLRARLEHFERQTEEARQEQLNTLLALEEARAERETYRKMVDELTARVEQLADAVDQAQERTDASHRFAMGRIEDATGEVRRYKELLAAANANTQAVKKDLEAEQSMSNALRQALNKLRDQQAQN